MDIRTYFLPLVLMGAFLFSPLEGVTKRKAESQLKDVTKFFLEAAGLFRYSYSCRDAERCVWHYHHETVSCWLHFWC